MRINPELTEDVGLDDVTAIPYLKEIAQQVDLEDTLEWLDDLQGTHVIIRVNIT